MICHLSLDPNFDIETATVLDIYNNISEKLVNRCILNCEDAKKRDNPLYREFIKFIFRLVAYLMHRIKHNENKENKVLHASIASTDVAIHKNTLENIIKDYSQADHSEVGYWQDYFIAMTEDKNSDILLDVNEALGCLYHEAENSFCFLHLTIQEYLCADFLVHYTDPLPSPPFRKREKIK